MALGAPLGSLAETAHRVRPDERPAPSVDETELIHRLREQASSMRVTEDRLTGEGATRLRDAARSAQFVALGEEHLSRAIPPFSVALFRLLHETYGFDHLALEEGPALGRLVSRAVRSAASDALTDLARGFPNAFHLLSWDELRMMSAVGKISRAAEPIWGLNQEFGAAHVYQRLVELAPDDTARAVAQRLLSRALEHERPRFARQVHYLARLAEPADFARLRDAFRPVAGSEVESLIEQTELSARTYAPYQAEPRPGAEAFRASTTLRERNMKNLLSDGLRRSRAAGNPPPKVLVKLGHYHLYRGRSMGTEVYTLGNFLSELAVYFGRESLHLFVVVDEPWLREKWPRPLALAAAAEAGRPGDALLFDLRPLAAWAQRAELHAEVRRLLLGYDFFVFLRDGESGSVEGLLGEGGRWYP